MNLNNQISSGFGKSGFGNKVDLTNSVNKLSKKETVKEKKLFEEEDDLHFCGRNRVAVGAGFEECRRKMPVVWLTRRCSGVRKSPEGLLRASTVVAGRKGGAHALSQLRDLLPSPLPPPPETEALRCQ
ncbi:hypothetical protein ACS0TY_012443 [Phlomoides rotata]